MGRKLKIGRIHKRILGYFARGDPIPFIIHNTGLKKSNFYKKIQTLEKYGYIKINRVGKILDIQLQPMAIKELGTLSVGAKKVDYINLHDVWVACKIFKKPTGWEKEGLVERILEMRSIDYTINRPNNWRGVFFDFASVTVRITPNKVMFNPPHIEIPTDDSPEHAKNLIMKYLEGVVPKIENMFNIKLTQPGRVSMTVSSQHIAFVKNLIAKYFVDREIDLKIYDEAGRLRVVVDKSPREGKPSYEMEFPNKAYAEEDADKMSKLIKDTVFGNFNHTEIKEDLSNASKIINKLAENQEIYREDLLEYGKKIAAHGKAIDMLGDGIDISNKTMNALGDGVKKLTSVIKRMESAKLRKPKLIQGKHNGIRKYWNIISKNERKMRNQRRLGDFV